MGALIIDVQEMMRCRDITTMMKCENWKRVKQDDLSNNRYGLRGFSLYENVEIYRYRIDIFLKISHNYKPPHEEPLLKGFEVIDF